MIALRPAAAWSTLSEKIGLTYPDIDQFMNEKFSPQKDEQNFWRTIKGTNEVFDEFGTIPDYTGLHAMKLEDAGLVYDESGKIIPKGEVGKLKAPFTFMIIGSSSMLEGLGPRIERDLKSIPQMRVIRSGKYSSGLTRPDFYNWNTQAQQLIASYQPQVIITQFGGNDGQTITDNRGRRIPYGGKGWDDAYKQKVDDFMRIISKVKRVYWLELPIAATPDFTEKFIRMNRIHSEVAAKYPTITYVKTWERFAPNGRFANVLPDNEGRKAVVKASDGVHLTEHGAKIMSSILMDYVREDIVLPE